MEWFLYDRDPRQERVKVVRVENIELFLWTDLVILIKVARVVNIKLGYRD